MLLQNDERGGDSVAVFVSASVCAKQIQSASERESLETARVLRTEKQRQCVEIIRLIHQIV